MLQYKPTKFTSLTLGLLLLLLILIQYVGSSHHVSSVKPEDPEDLIGKAHQPPINVLRAGLAIKDYAREQARHIDNLRKSRNNLVAAGTSESSDVSSNVQGDIGENSGVFADESFETMESGQREATQEEAEIEFKQQRISTLDSRIVTEPYDAEWASEMQQTIQAAMKQFALTGSQLGQLTCRSSLCRLKVKHESTDAELVFLQQFLAKAGFTNTDAYYTREITEDDGVQMTYYVSRDGQRLSTPKSLPRGISRMTTRPVVR